MEVELDQRFMMRQEASQRCQISSIFLEFFQLAYDGFKNDGQPY